MTNGANVGARGVEVVDSSVADEPGRTWTVPFAMAAVRIARAQITVALRQAKIAHHVIEDARIVVSELLGNALRHARPLPDGTLRIRLLVDDGAVRISVLDGGSVTLPTLLHPPPMAVSGRGLAIVRTLTRDWGVQESRGGNTVFGVLSLS